MRAEIRAKRVSKRISRGFCGPSFHVSQIAPNAVRCGTTNGACASGTCCVTVRSTGSNCCRKNPFDPDMAQNPLPSRMIPATELAPGFSEPVSLPVAVSTIPTLPTRNADALDEPFLVTATPTAALAARSTAMAAPARLRGRMPSNLRLTLRPSSRPGAACVEWISTTPTGFSKPLRRSTRRKP